MLTSGSHIIKLILLLILPLIFFSCESNKPDLLPGTWEMTEYRINHFDEHKDINVKWQFNADGTFSQEIRYPNYEVVESGKWTLLNGESIQMDYTQNNMKVEWKIVYINETLLKVEHTTPGFFVERSFKKQ